MSHAEGVTALDLMVYTRSFSTLVSAGVSLVRCLDILQEISDQPLVSATAELFRQVSERERTLSDAMKERPDVFTRLCVQMMRAGEIGGVLDEALAQLADLVEADCVVGEAGRTHFRSLLIPPDKGLSFGECAPHDRLRLLSVSCRMLGMMLSAGVPLAEGPHNALSTAAEILPPGPEREALAAIPKRMEEGAQFHEHLQLPFLPRYLPTLARIGVETATLDRMFEKAAQLFEYQRRHYLLKRAE
jgi:type II secretory pathway component PulF